MKYKLSKSKLSGLGFFATEDIQKGETIKILSGKPLKGKEVDSMIISKKMAADDEFQINEDDFMQLDEYSYYFNHSCDPNAGVRGRCELFAIKQIKKNDEIFYDYSTTVGLTKPKSWLLDNQDWSMDCKCSARICRGKISYVLSIPQPVLKKYQQLGILPDFILDQLKLASL